MVNMDTEVSNLISFDKRIIKPLYDDVAIGTKDSKKENGTANNPRRRSSIRRKSLLSEKVEGILDENTSRPTVSPDFNTLLVSPTITPKSRRKTLKSNRRSPVQSTPRLIKSMKNHEASSEATRTMSSFMLDAVPDTSENSSSQEWCQTIQISRKMDKKDKGTMSPPQLVGSLKKREKTLCVQESSIVEDTVDFLLPLWSLFDDEGNEVACVEEKIHNGSHRRHSTTGTRLSSQTTLTSSSQSSLSTEFKVSNTRKSLAQTAAKQTFAFYAKEPLYPNQRRSRRREGSNVQVWYHWADFCKQPSGLIGQNMTYKMTLRYPKPQDMGKGASTKQYQIVKTDCVGKEGNFPPVSPLLSFLKSPRKERRGVQEGGSLPPPPPLFESPSAGTTNEVRKRSWSPRTKRKMMKSPKFVIQNENRESCAILDVAKSLHPDSSKRNSTQHHVTVLDNSSDPLLLISFLAIMEKF